MLLNLYFVTTGISWTVTILFVLATESKLERQGYQFVKKNKTFFEKIISILCTVFKASIPIYNIINSICLLILGEKAIDLVIEHAIEEELAIPKVNFDYNNVKDLSEEKVANNNISMNSINTEKSYDEMSNELKLEWLNHEREILLGKTLEEPKQKKVK